MNSITRYKLNTFLIDINSTVYYRFRIIDIHIHEGERATILIFLFFLKSFLIMWKYIVIVTHSKCNNLSRGGGSYVPGVIVFIFFPVSNFSTRRLDPIGTYVVCTHLPVENVI